MHLVVSCLGTSPSRLVACLPVHSLLVASVPEVASVRGPSLLATLVSLASLGTVFVIVLAHLVSWPALLRPLQRKRLHHRHQLEAIVFKEQ